MVKEIATLKRGAKFFKEKIKGMLLETLQSYESDCKTFLSQRIDVAAVDSEMKSGDFWWLYYVLLTHINELVKSGLTCTTLNDQHHQTIHENLSASPHQQVYLRNLYEKSNFRHKNVASLNS